MNRVYRLSMNEAGPWATSEASRETLRRNARACYPRATTIEIIAPAGDILETLTFAAPVSP